MVGKKLPMACIEQGLHFSEFKNKAKKVLKRFDNRKTFELTIATHSWEMIKVIVSVVKNVEIELRPK